MNIHISDVRLKRLTEQALQGLSSTERHRLDERIQYVSDRVTINHKAWNSMEVAYRRTLAWNPANDGWVNTHMIKSFIELNNHTLKNDSDEQALEAITVELKRHTR